VLLWLLDNAFPPLPGGGDGLVASVERFEAIPKSYSELAERESDSTETCRAAVGPEVAKMWEEEWSGPSMRRRTFGGGPSACKAGEGAS
jgi:hypothetical protein